MKTATATTVAPRRRRAAVPRTPATKVDPLVASIRRSVESHWQDEVMLGRTATERHHVVTREGVNTGYWSWKGDRHSVTIGEAIRETKPNIKGKDAYIGAYLRHELSHALWTERDLEKLDQHCKRAGIPFRLVNLFEDARIEHKYREVYKTPFNWLDHEVMPPSDKPGAAFFALIQAEGAMLHEWKDLPAGDFRVRVAHYYERTIAAADSWEVLRIAMDWKKEFPEACDERSLPQFAFDMLMSLQVATGAIDDTKGVCILVDGDGKPGRGQKEESEERKGSNRDAEASNAINLDRKGEHPLTPEQMEQATMLANRMSAEFVTRKGWSSTETATRRLNTRRLALDSSSVYRARTEARSGKIRIGVVIDLSGSMSGGPSEFARVVLTALAILSSRGHADGFVTLSSARGHETFGLAMSDGQIAGVEGFDYAEGLQSTFRRMESKLKQCDLVMCLTDGNITDGPVDVARLKAAGVSCLGLYVGAEDNARRLTSWFAQSLCRPSIQEVIDEISIRIRPFIRAKVKRV